MPIKVFSTDGFDDNRCLAFIIIKSHFRLLRVRLYKRYDNIIVVETISSNALCLYNHPCVKTYSTTARWRQRFDNPIVCLPEFRQSTDFALDAGERILLCPPIPRRNHCL